MEMDPITSAQRATIDYPYFTARGLEQMMDMDALRHLGIYDVGYNYWGHYGGPAGTGIEAFFTNRGPVLPEEYEQRGDQFQPLYNYNWQQAFPDYSYDETMVVDNDWLLENPAQIQMGMSNYPLSRSDQAFILEQVIPEVLSLADIPSVTQAEIDEALKNWQDLYGPKGTGLELQGLPGGRFPEHVQLHEYGHVLDPTSDDTSEEREEAFADHYAAIVDYANEINKQTSGWPQQFTGYPGTISGLEADTPFNTLMANFPGYGKNEGRWGGDREFFAESLALAGRFGLDAIPPALQRFYSGLVTNEYDPVVRNIPYLYPTSEPQEVNIDDVGWEDPRTHPQWIGGTPAYRGNAHLALAERIRDGAGAPTGFIGQLLDPH